MCKDQSKIKSIEQEESLTQEDCYMSSDTFYDLPPNKYMHQKKAHN